MILITSHLEYIKVDLTAFSQLDSVEYLHIYLMKDQTFSVKLTKNLDRVEIYSENEVYELDMNGVKGLPAIVNNKTPLNNMQLAEMLAKLKDL